MSFVERNKLWLLPLLALGVGAVGWYNYQAFAGPKPTPVSTPTDPPQVPSAEAPAPTPGPTPVAAVSEGPGGLWDDLKPLAVVPGDLNRLESLDSQARGVLSASMLQDGGSEALRLVGPRVWTPKERPRPAAEGQEGPPGLAAPDPDILIQLPEGRRVWIDGVGYREQQPLDQAPWRVRRIQPRAVELQSPRGTEVKPIHPAPKEGP